MKIDRVELKESTWGLRPFCMEKLGKAVILVGCNGSGKTRLLKMLERKIKTQGNISDALDTLQIKYVQEDLGKNFLNYSHYDAPLQLPDAFPPHVIATAKERLIASDFDGTTKDVLLYVKSLAMGWEDENELTEFNKWVQLLLGDIFALEGSGEPRFFTQTLSSMHLSPGQEYLLRMCVALHCKDTTINDILFLDEPETHLHPEVLITVLNKLHEKFANGQIWIATHSIPALSALPEADVWYMENGLAKRVGSNSKPIVDGLIGGDGYRSKLWKFLALPEVFACNNFASQCLLPPDTRPASQKDPQVEMVADTIRATAENGKPLRILDFGAGQGRLLESLYLDELDTSKLPELDYYAYDLSEENKSICCSLMVRHGHKKDGYYNDISRLKQDLASRIDKIFMVNVLHEIDPIFWLVLFGNLVELLDDNGQLVIVEKEELTYGEQPYSNGFLVMEELAMGSLLGRDDFDFARHPDRNDIVRYLIPKEALKNITTESIAAAVECIGKIALDEIRNIQQTSIALKKQAQAIQLGFKEGVRLAFYAHQYASANLFLNN